jgi:L-alanine-DL-glutamate epimerase-like enolase superfamily enzyme
MRIQTAVLHFMEIPFRLSFGHGARAARISSDSIVLELAAGNSVGYGEAVVREYVSGSLGTGGDMREEAARITERLLSPLRERNLTWQEAHAHLAGLRCDPPALPLMCALESAILACAAEEAGTDPWSVLGREPVRSTVLYGGVLPLGSLDSARPFIALCARMELPNLKVKVGADAAHNAAILGLCRQVLGQGFDIRVDANSAWTPANVDAQLEVCGLSGVRMIEQPFPVSAGTAAAARVARKGFAVMADEGVLTLQDVGLLASTGAAQALNLRLSKNGGMGRVLALAAEAEAKGMSYQLGCMVGETGILSGMGRLTASLLPRPLYIEGSYDEMLLEENIVSPGFGFGQGGRAGIVRSAGLGSRVQRAQLEKFSRARVSV